MSCFDHTLAYFYKDSVTSCKEIQKDCCKKERIEKDCYKKKSKKIVIKKIVKRLHVSNKIDSVVM